MKKAFIFIIAAFIFLGNAFADNNGSDKISERFYSKQILVGFSGHNVTNLAGKNKNDKISNTSWMSYTKHGILMNNEWGGGGGVLYLVKKNNPSRVLVTHPLEKVKSPVYFSPLIDKKIYIAGYGAGGEDNKAGGVIITDSKLKNVKEYPTGKDGSRIHFINEFKPLKNDSPFLVAVDVGLGKLYKFDKSTYKSTYKFTELYGFGEALPRRFVQIPGTNKIVVIIERPQTGSEHLPVKLIMLEYDNGEFNQIGSYNLSNLLTKGGDKGLVGAELKYYKNNLYATVRTYRKQYEHDPVEPMASAGGFLAKFKLNDDTISLVKKVRVGANPRYFAIDERNSIAYVVAQESKAIILVDLQNMKLNKMYTYIEGGPMFILLPKGKSSGMNNSQDKVSYLLKPES